MERRSPEQLTDHPEYDGGPVWSPDGRYILFATRRTGLLAIWVMRADGTGETVLYDSPDEDLMMAWTPWATVPPAE
jgi:TolB protein